MAEIQVAAGATLAIAPAGSTIDQTSDATAITSFEGLTYTEVELVESIGAFGDTAAQITFTALKDGRVRKAKGSRDAGTLEVTVARDPADPGQDALKAAERTPFSYPIRVRLNDAPPGAGSEPSVFYFLAKVSSAPVNVGTVDEVIRITYTLDIDSAVYEIEASA